jgi:ubiquinone/menaquinone biosynthesis C-methylase UbiE
MKQLNLIRKQFNKRAKSYEEYTKWVEDPLLFELCIEPLKEMKLSSKCLDLGGGTGWIAREENKRSGRLWYVLDISSKMGQFVKHPLYFVLRDAHSTIFKDNMFDFIIIRSVLQYTNASIVLQEVKRILKNKGRFVIAQKVLDGFAQDIEWYLTIEKLRNPLKRNLGFRKDIEELVKSIGFKIIKSQNYAQKYQIKLEKWLTREGTISSKNRKKILNQIKDLPESFSERTGFRVQNGKVKSILTWGVIVCKK